jgi:hypothetical protein
MRMVGRLTPIGRLTMEDQPLQVTRNIESRLPLRQQFSTSDDERSGYRLTDWR